MPDDPSILPEAALAAMLDDLRRMIEDTRAAVATTVNTGLTMLYWRIGKRINEDVLQGERAEYGKQIVATVSRRLTEEYGSGFSEKYVRRMIQFAEVFPDEAIVVSLVRQLSWTHFIALIPLQDPLQRDYYAEMCRIERWSVRTLRAKIDSMLYERTALSKKPETLIREELDALRDADRLSPDLVFRDPYVLDFLGLNDRYLERDLEDAILRELEHFLLELGAGFSFVARQQRIPVDHEDYALDLLFFHRPLRRLVAIELKLGTFKPAYKGQMELYLAWLDRHERQPHEEAPIGLILCAGKKRETIELLSLDEGDIRVAEYWTVLPPKAVLEQRLHRAIAEARHRFETYRLPDDDETT